MKKKQKESSKAEGNGFGDRSILVVPSDFFFFLALSFLIKACFQGIYKSMKSTDHCLGFTESWSLHIFNLAKN